MVLLERLVIRRESWSRYASYLLGGLVTVICLAVFLRQLNLVELRLALADFDLAYLGLGLSSLTLGYSLRIMRWTLMLRAVHPGISWQCCAAPFLGSIALNNVLPLRLGDVVRALVFPASMGITKTTATSSLVVERLADIVALVLCLAAGISAIGVVDIPDSLSRMAALLALLGTGALVAGLVFSGPLASCLTVWVGASLRLQGSVSGRIALVLAGLLRGLDQMLKPSLLLSILLVSALVWIAEAGLFFFVLLGAGFDATPLMALLVMAVATLSTLVPSSPGYIGSFHLAVFAAASLVGAGAAQAGSYAIIVHLALWLPTTLAGLFAIWVRPEIFRAARLGQAPGVN